MVANIESFEIEYIDIRPEYYPFLTFYPRGIELPRKNGDNVIKVSAGEKRKLLKRKNGLKPVFAEKGRRRKAEEV